MVQLTGENVNVVVDGLFSVTSVLNFKVFFRLSPRRTHKKYKKALIITAYIQILVNSSNFNSCFMHLDS